jgi:hypothetical protein
VQTWTYLSRRKPALPTLDKSMTVSMEDKKAVHEFRLEFIRAMIDENVHTSRGLAKLLGNMLKMYTGVDVVDRRGI